MRTAGRAFETACKAEGGGYLRKEVHRPATERERPADDCLRMAKDVPAPMEALLAAELPAGGGWQYEPKWDGFRCLAQRDGDRIELTSKSGKPLGRYFPEIVVMLALL